MFYNKSFTCNFCGNKEHLYQPFNNYIEEIPCVSVSI